jgi:hypothetical protein
MDRRLPAHHFLDKAVDQPLVLDRFRAFAGDLRLGRKS